MFYVYLIRGTLNNKFYIGYTNNLKKRIQEHRDGKSYWSERILPFKLIYYEAFVSKIDAQNREKQLKQHGKALAFLKKRITYSIREGC